MVLSILTTQILVVQRNLDIGRRKEDSVLLRFAPGDTILFEAEVIKGNDISEIEVVDYFSRTVIFKDLARKKVRETLINGPDTSFYVFRFKNTSLIRGKVYRLKVLRKPSDSRFADFRTLPIWKTIVETTFVEVYDTVYKDVIEVKELYKDIVKIDATVSFGECKKQVEIPVDLEIDITSDTLLGIKLLVSSFGKREYVDNFFSSLEGILAVNTDSSTILGSILKVVSPSIKGVVDIELSIWDYEKSAWTLKAKRTMLEMLLTDRYLIPTKDSSTYFQKRKKTYKGNLKILLNNCYSVFKGKYTGIILLSIIKHRQISGIKSIKKPKITIKRIPG